MVLLSCLFKRISNRNNTMTTTSNRTTGTHVNDYSTYSYVLLELLFQHGVARERVNHQLQPCGSTTGEAIVLDCCCRLFVPTFSTPNLSLDRGLCVSEEERGFWL